MNPTEQKNHKTVTATLSREFDEFAARAVIRFEELDLKISDERTNSLKLDEEQRKYVDAAIDQLSSRIEELRHHGFWSRLNWLVTGR